MSSRAALETGFLTRPRIARASTSERTSGNPSRLGGRTLFLRTATSCGPRHGHREIVCRRGGVRRCRGPLHALRAGATDSCVPRPRSADRRTPIVRSKAANLLHVDFLGRGRKTSSRHVCNHSLTQLTHRGHPLFEPPETRASRRFERIPSMISSREKCSNYGEAVQSNGAYVGRRRRRAEVIG